MLHSLLQVTHILIRSSYSKIMPSWSSQGMECVHFGDLRTASLLSADDVALLASSGCGLKDRLEQCVAECSSLAKSETIVVFWQIVDSPLLFSNEFLFKVKIYYLEVFFMSKGKKEH